MTQYKTLETSQRRMYSVLGFLDGNPFKVFTPEQFEEAQQHLTDIPGIPELTKKNYKYQKFDIETISAIKQALLKNQRADLANLIKYNSAFVVKAPAEEYNDKMQSDGARAKFFLQRTQSFESSRAEVFKRSESGGYYTQGDFAGGSYGAMLKLSPVAAEKTPEAAYEGKQYFTESSFTYFDDNGQACGLTICRVGYDPGSYYVYHTQNCNAELLEDRKVKIFYAADLFKNHEVNDPNPSAPILYPDAREENGENDPRNQVAVNDINITSLEAEILGTINSEAVKKFLADSLLEGGTISATKLENLQESLRVRNLSSFILNHMLDAAEIPKESADEVSVTRDGKDTSLARVNIELEAATRPAEFYQAENFKHNLIAIIHKAHPDKKSETLLEYLKFIVGEYPEAVREDLLQAIQDPVFNPNTYLELQFLISTSSEKVKSLYYKFYLEYCAATTANETEQRRLFRRIASLEHNDGTEYAELLTNNERLDDAIRIAANPNTVPNYDPQGRLLVDVGDCIVSLDISKHPTLQQGYNASLQAFLIGQDTSKAAAASIVDSLNKLPSKSSIIFLQHELHFHLALALRTYQDQFSKITDPSIHPETMQAVNAMVMQAFANALKVATNDGQNDVNLKVLNAELNQARADITPKAHRVLLAKIMEKHPKLDLTQFSESDAKTTAKKTPATAKPILHIDYGKATATELGPSDYTSHDRRRGGRFAHRSIKYWRLSETEGIKYRVGGSQVRSPSLPVKTGLTEDKYILDTVDKLTNIRKDHGFQQPFTYNLLTAMQDTLDDNLTKNYQTQSARHIILGAHAYNKENLTENNNRCLVQAISVNGFGAPLGYPRVGLSVALRNEATLLSEMALHYNITRNRGLMSTYEDFLRRPQYGFIERILNLFTSNYFFRSQQGRRVRQEIESKKASWQQVTEVDERDITALVKTSLQKVMAYDLHFSHEHAKLVQALSIFLEDESIIGCKSGNERTPIICEREQLLEQPDIPEDLRAAFLAMAEASNAQKSLDAARKLKAVIDKHYDDENLYGPTAMIPLDDQGAGHKIESKRKMFENHNKAEEASILNLQQSNTRPMQAHNGLADYMHDAVKARLQAANEEDLDSKIDDKSLATGSTGMMMGVMPHQVVPDNIYATVKSAEEHEDEDALAERETLVSSHVSTHNNIQGGTGVNRRVAPEPLDEDDDYNPGQGFH